MQEYRVWSKKDRGFLKKGDWLETSLDRSSISENIDTIMLGEYEDLVFVQLTGAIDAAGKPVSDGDVVLWEGEIYIVEMKDFTWSLVSEDKAIRFPDIVENGDTIDCTVIGSAKCNANILITK